MMEQLICLRVLLHKCEGLVSKSSCVTLATSIHPDMVQRSPTKNTASPVWDPPQRFVFDLEEWENEFLSVQIYDSGNGKKDCIIGSAVIPLMLFAGGRHTGEHRYPLVVPDQFIGTESRSDIFMDISLTDVDGLPVDFAYESEEEGDIGNESDGSDFDDDNWI